MEAKKKISPSVVLIIVVVLVGIVVSASIIVENNKTANNESSSSVAQTPDTRDFADGTYSAKGSYVTPGGVETIGLTVTIKDGVITDTQLDTYATDRDAVQYQSEFENGYASLIVGKEIGEVSLSRVAGSSLTSNGFNKALKQIRDDAAV